MFRGYSLSRILGWGCCKDALGPAEVGGYTEGLGNLLDPVRGVS
jgi:hypothetical protein